MDWRCYDFVDRIVVGGCWLVVSRLVVGGWWLDCYWLLVVGGWRLLVVVGWLVANGRLSSRGAISL